jgi:thiamine kinase-like enzyme
MDLIEVSKNFLTDKKIKSCAPFGNGHINSTYKVVLENDIQEYILQKINTNVFTNPKNIIHNHTHLQEAIISHELEIPHLVKTNQNKYLFFDKNQEVWRMMNFIQDSYSIEVVENSDQAYEAGRGFGWFLKACSHLNSMNFHEAIKDFHSLSLRINQLNEAIRNAKDKRLKNANELISFYKQREANLLEIESSLIKDKIPLRLVHNDTKINNLLFRNKKAAAVIDLDTVGPGFVLFDYGDAIRTITNTAAEDEKDLNKIEFNVASFESFTKGYLEQTKSVLTLKEKSLLFYAPFYMTFIIGIRFLADYLNGDIYYKTEYSEHNLVRSSTQKTLIERMENRSVEIKQILERYTI